MQNKSEQTQNDKQNNSKSETIRELAHRHLLNQNHTTTDEELRNARIELSDRFDTSVEDLNKLSDADNDTVLPAIPFEKNIENDNAGVLGLKNEKEPIPNPYDVLK